jgi:hypothetical protein
MSYRPEWIPGALVALVALLCAPPLALIAFLILALAVLLAVAGAIAVTPYLLFRSVRSRWAGNVADRRNAKPTSRGLTPVPSKEM